jgi:hypothetical protein
VDIHTIMMLKRREQKPPAGHEANLVNVMRFGYALPMDEGVNELRRVQGLEDVELIPGEWVKLLVHEEEDGQTR